MNRISGMKHDQIITLYQAGKSGRWIARHLGIDRETVSVHLRMAGFALPRGRQPSGGPKPAISVGVPTDSGQIQPFPPGVPTDPLASVQTPPFPERRCPPSTPSACEAYRAVIEDCAARGQPAQVIWQDLVDEHGFTAGYDSVKRFVRKLKATSADVFAVIPTEPGLEAQVDYGRGAPRIVKLDNLKEGVIRPDIYDPELNPLYAAMLAHYGVVASPCRVATPRHKGKSESDIKYAQNTLKGRRFERIEDQQSFLDHWDRRWASTRIHGVIKRLIRKAEAIGVQTAALVREIIRQQPYHAIRQAQGILSFTRRHPPAILENAARQCAERGLFTYRGVKQLIAYAQTPSDSRPPELTQQHPIIRTATAYQDLWSSAVHHGQKGTTPC